MNIVSSSDSGFFHCAVELAKSVRKHYGKPLILYDVGLTAQQRTAIDAQVIPIEISVEFQSHATKDKGTFIQATHKPFCVQHYFEHNSEPMIFVDADCLFTQHVEETGFDVGVTLRSTHVDKTNPYNGLLNTGVIFFNTGPKELLDRWALECGRENTTDQKALSDILSETIDWNHYNKVYDWHGLKVKVFGTSEYNDFYLKKGKIIHFKGRRHDKEFYPQLLDAYYSGSNTYDLFLKLTKKKVNLKEDIFAFFRRFF
jgi:hypothetical protein